MNFVPNPLELQTLADALERVGQPAFVLDPSRGRLLAANRQGRLAWGLPADTRPAPLSLDLAMPAFAALRECEERAPPVPIRLTFWTLRGVRSWVCAVRRPRSEATRGTLLVTVEGSGPVRMAPRPEPTPRPPAAASVPAPRAAAPAAGQGTADQSSAGQASAAPRAMSEQDAATLQEIARRIRGGSAPTPGDAAATTGHAGVHGSSDIAPAARGATVAVATSADAAPAPSPERFETLANLAHELRTPLAAIVALAEVLTQGHLGALANDRQRDYLGSIGNAARHMIGVVDSMLSRRARASQGPQLTFTDVDLNALAAEILPALEPLADRSGVTLSYAFAIGMPRVVADRLAVRQILINLLSNALRHAGQGARAMVRTGRSAAGDAWLEVEDDGRGIDPAVLQRLEGTAGPEPDGSLGLPLSQRLAQATGGKLTVERVEPKGTRARVTFPASRTVPV